MSQFFDTQQAASHAPQGRRFVEGSEDEGGPEAPVDLERCIPSSIYNRRIRRQHSGRITQNSGDWFGA